MNLIKKIQESSVSAKLMLTGALFIAAGAGFKVGYNQGLLNQQEPKVLVEYTIPKDPHDLSMHNHGNTWKIMKANEVDNFISNEGRGAWGIQNIRVYPFSSQ